MSRTKDISQEKRALVTGGAGFIGSHLLEALFKNGWATHCIDALTYAGSKENLTAVAGKAHQHFTHGNILDRPTIEAILYEFKPTHIFHLAAESHVDRSIENADDFIQTNIVGTTTLLDLFSAYYASSKLEDVKFIHVSTDEVFGALGNEGIFDETSPYRPNSPYSASKAASDHLARAWANTYDLPIIITNCSNNFGPHQHNEKLIPTIINKALSGKPIPIYGLGENIRDWLYVKDHVDALLSIADAREPATQYCIGGGYEISNLALCKKICCELDRIRPQGKHKYASQITFVDDRKGHDFRYAIDSSKIKNDLGWEPKHDFDKALIHTIEFYVARYHDQ